MDAKGDKAGSLRRRMTLLLAIGFSLMLVLMTLADARWTLAELTRAGIAAGPGQLWLREATAMASWLPLLPALWLLVARVYPPRLRLAGALTVLAAASVPASALHQLLAGLLRLAASELVTGDYLRAWIGAPFELYRRDAFVYVQTVSLFVMARWLLLRAAGASRVLEVHEGETLHRVPVDRIEHVAAAGNHVEIAWGGNSLRTLVGRSTLAALAENLGDDFVRIHASRIVRRSAIRRIETDDSGDFTVELASGALLRGSARYRGALAAETDERA